MALWSALLARPNRTPLTARPSLTLYFLLSGAFLLTLVPHAVQFPSWLSLTIVAAMVLRSIIEVYRLPLPSTTFCGIIAVSLLGFILLQYGTVLGRDAGTAFTAGLLALKFYELRRPRDVALIIFSCFFVVMSALLYSQVLELFIYCLIMMWVLTALLLRVHAGDLPSDRLLRMLGQSGLIFLQAFPLALFLFFFFPRYTGPIGLPLDEATLGLSDTVTPGSIAKLSQNDELAMYVQFTPGSNIPLPNSMYWRALVLWQYNHGAWTPGDIAEEEIPFKVQTKAEPDQVAQQITIHAHHRRWLFALDAPVSLPFNPSEPLSWATAFTGDVLQLTATKLDHTARYDVISTSSSAGQYLGARQKSRALQLPDDPKDLIDPDVKALADQLHQGLSDDQSEDYISSVIHYFRHGGFVYSSSPGVQGPNWLKVFLFKNKTGFCEHYASAFAILMRLEHVPTRLVVGYLGADYNPYTDTYTVSQSNAHAWDEVWIPDKNQPPEGVKGRWKRIDPTALITAAGPGETATTSGPGDAGAVRIAHRSPSFAETYLPEWAKEDLREFKLRREEIETNWDNIVLSYDPEVQGRWAQALGFGARAGFSLLAISLLVALLFLFLLHRWMSRKLAVSPVEKLYAAFCRAMAHRGIPRATWEGPLAYTERVAEAFPDDKPALQRVGFLVAQVRYGPVPADPGASEKLSQLLTLLTASQAAASSRERH